MKNNSELQIDVQNAIKWKPLLNAAEIGVTAKDGIVSLTISISSWYQKEEAGRIAWNTPGIWRVNNDLAVEHKYFLG
jgi:osmotically-inducible protein OsmY